MTQPFLRKFLCGKNKGSRHPNWCHWYAVQNWISLNGKEDPQIELLRRDPVISKFVNALVPCLLDNLTALREQRLHQMHANSKNMVHEGNGILEQVIYCCLVIRYISTQGQSFRRKIDKPWLSFQLKEEGRHRRIFIVTITSKWQDYFRKIAHSADFDQAACLSEDSSVKNFA